MFCALTLPRNRLSQLETHSYPPQLFFRAPKTSLPFSILSCNLTHCPTCLKMFSRYLNVLSLNKPSPFSFSQSFLLLWQTIHGFCWHSPSAYTSFTLFQTFTMYCRSYGYLCTNTVSYALKNLLTIQSFPSCSSLTPVPLLIVTVFCTTFLFHL